MFEAFYNLSDNPFRLTPDPKFCFRHPSHDQAYAYLQYALKLGEGFIMVTGRPGIGKTTLAQVFLSELELTEVVAARVAAANVEATDLMRVVAYAYGIDVEGLDKATVLVRLRQFFTEQVRAGKRVLLIIDEAQGLPYPALEELRLLADMQMDSRPLLQLFLVGQDKLRDLMQEPAMEQFQQRVIGVCHLEPLSLTDTRAYMEHRLRKADWQGNPELTGEALLAIYQFSKGVPRHVNKICTRLLLDGFMEKKHILNEHDVLEVANALRAERLAPLGSDQAAAADAKDKALPAELENGTLTVADLALRTDPLQPPPDAVKLPAEVVAVVEERAGAGQAEQAATGPAQATLDITGVSSGTVSGCSGNRGSPQRRRRNPPPAAGRDQRRHNERTGIPAWKPTPALQFNKRIRHLASIAGQVNDRLSGMYKEFDFHDMSTRLRRFRRKVTHYLEDHPVFSGRPGMWVGVAAAVALSITLLLNSVGEKPGDQYGAMRERASEPAGATLAVAEPEPMLPAAQVADRRDFESASLESYEYRPVTPREEKRVNRDKPEQQIGTVVTAASRSPVLVPPAPEGNRLAGDAIVLSKAEGIYVPDGAEEVQDNAGDQKPEPLPPVVAAMNSKDAEDVPVAPLEPAESSVAQAKVTVDVTESVQVVPGDTVMVAGNSSAPEPVSREDRLIELLSLGQRALRDYRLLIPAGNSAYEYYQQVLELEPDNKAALFGLDQIVERYVTLGDNALVAEDRVKANRYIARGFRVMPGDSRLLALQSRVNAPVVADAPVEVRPPEQAEPEKKNLSSWLKTIFGERRSPDGKDEVQVDDYSF